MTKFMRKLNRILRVYVVIGSVIAVIGILAMQTQLSILNQELNSNMNILDDLKENNTYLEMQKNESLTRDKIAVFADQNGLVQSFSNVIDISEERELD